MKVVVTGHHGYIGSVLVPMFQEAGHEVLGLDNFLFEGCDFSEGPKTEEIRKDVRDVRASDFEGFDAVIHLAGISNDPLGDLNPGCTHDINSLGSVHVAEMAKRAGVKRFLQSSSCSLYGASMAGDDFINEDGEFNPVTPYGESKVYVEQHLTKMASDEFSPTYLRNSTAYGLSARLRGDLVVNNLVGYAYTTGKVLMKSDGTPWRPLVHIRDISKAFLAAMEADREIVHNEAFNVGSTEENYRIRDVAKIVEDVVTGSTVTLADQAGPDKRNYRVNCDKILRVLPASAPEWTVRRGAGELYEAFKAVDLKVDELESSRYMRIQHVKEQLAVGAINDSLRVLKG